MEVTLTGDKLIHFLFFSYTIFFLLTIFFFLGACFNRIYLMGQSAGAHISACALLELAIQESEQVDNASLKVSQLKAYFGLSGG